MEYSDFQEIKMLLEKKTDVITCISKVAVLKELKEKLLKEVKLKNITIKRNFYFLGKMRFLKGGKFGGREIEKFETNSLQRKSGVVEWKKRK